MNLVFAFVAIVAGVFIAGKIFTKATAPVAPLTCPVVPATAISDEVKAFLEARLRAQNPAGSMGDLTARMEKMERSLAEARKQDADAKALGDKIAEFEKFSAQQRASADEFTKERAKAEFIRLGNAMTLLCRPKGAPPPPPRLPTAPSPIGVAPPSTAPVVAPPPAAPESKQ